MFKDLKNRNIDKDPRDKVLFLVKIPNITMVSAHILTRMVIFNQKSPKIS